MESHSYISLARKLNQCNLFTYTHACEKMLELIYILKCVIIILHFMIIKLWVIKTVRSINDNILYIYLYVIHNKHPYILMRKMMYFKHYLAILYIFNEPNKNPLKQFTSKSE